MHNQLVARSRFMVGTLLAGALVLSACPKPNAASTESEFCQERAEAECEKLQSACALSTLDVCVNTRRVACTQWAANLKVGAHAFRAAKTGDCLDEIRATLGPAVPAARVAQVEAVCARVFEGTGVVNAPCTQDFDCVSPLTCDPGKALCSTRREVAAGAGCANPGEICQPGQFCASTPTPQGTTLLVCTPRATLGTACSDVRPCVEALRCLPNATCEPRMGLGSACTDDGSCTTNFCDDYAGVCTDGLSFAPGSPSCVGFTGQTAANAPDAAARD